MSGQGDAIRRLWNRLRRKPREREDAQRFVMTGDRHWGGAIMFWPERCPTDLASFRVTGWTSPRPRVGDLLLVPMESGRWLECALVEVDLYRDPPDMWSATASSLERYSDETPTVERFSTQLVKSAARRPVRAGFARRTSYDRPR